jgi:hypothetical protein
VSATAVDEVRAGATGRCLIEAAVQRVAGIVPGTRPNKETVSALVNATMEAAALTRPTTTGRSAGCWRPATVIATNNSLLSVAAHSAIVASNSR